MITNKSLGFGGIGLNNTLPKMIAELQGLTVSGPFNGVAQNTEIAIPGIDLGDAILCVMQHNAGTLTNVTSSASVIDRRASGTLTLAGVVAGDKVSVDGKVYTFVAAPGFAQNLAPYQVALGSNDTGSAANLVKALMSGDSSIFASSVGAVVTVYWRVLGTVGNAITLSVAQSNGHVTASGATLAGGNDTQGISISVVTTGQVVVTWYNSPTQGK